MTYRTNRRTGGVFRVNTTRLGAVRPRLDDVPAETKYFRDVAKQFGLRARFEVRDLDKLKSRGFPPDESSDVSEQRKDYIRENLDNIAYILIDSKTGDIIDGNHRWVAFKEFGVARAPVLAVSGLEERMDSFDEWIGNYNMNAGYETVPDYYGKLPHELTRAERQEVYHRNA